MKTWLSVDPGNNSSLCLFINLSLKQQEIQHLFLFSIRWLLKDWWAFSEMQNAEKNEPWSVPNLLLTYQRHILVIYIFFALAYPPETSQDGENYIAQRMYYYYCIPSAGWTQTWIVETQNFQKSKQHLNHTISIYMYFPHSKIGLLTSIFVFKYSKLHYLRRMTAG